jgi:hypothetical protein
MVLLACVDIGQVFLLGLKMLCRDIFEDSLQLVEVHLAVELV